MDKALGRIRVFSRASVFRRLGLATAAALLATVLSLYINPLLGHKAPFLFHAAAIAIIAQYGGTVPGLITTVLSLLLTQSVLVLYGGASLSKPAELLGTFVVLCVGIFLSFFFGKRRREEEELLRIRYNLEAAQQIANIGSWESDLVTGSLWWSPETRHIFGVSEDAVLSKEDFYRLAYPDDRDRVRGLANNAIKTGEEYDVEHRIVTSTGEVRYVHQIAKVLCNSAGVPIRLIGSIQDITDRKLAEQEIRTLRGLLPICAHCKRIRDDQAGGKWFPVETFVKKHSEANFSHGICPECYKTFYEKR